MTRKQETNTITYKINSSVSSKSLTDWFFGKAFVATRIAIAKHENKKTGKKEFRFWQDGTGWLTIFLP